MVWKGNSLIVLFIAYFFCSNLPAQNLEEQKVDSTWWKNKTEQLDYTEDEWETKNFTMNNPSMDWINNAYIKYGILFLIVLVLLFILYKIYAKDLLSGGNENEEKSYHLLTKEDLDDRFLEMDLDNLLETAVSKKDWKGAIRIQFLLTIKLLIQLQKIEWHKDQTNLHIIYQLSAKEERDELSSLVEEFEKRWYGDQKTTKADYEKYDQDTLHFKTIIKRVN